MPFIPHTLRDTAEMLEAIGVSSIQELFDEIPSNLKAAELKQIPAGMTEAELTRLMQKRSAEDGQQLCFIGAGAYAHPIPAAVWELVSRGEFMTAYTPYQAEASQGTLQLIYEYQTMMSSLMSMDVSNASLYDGASGLSEAILMAVRANKKNQNRLVAVVGSLSPDYLLTIRSILREQNIEVQVFEACPQEGQFVAVVITQPTFLGTIQDVDHLTDWAHSIGALVVGLVNPVAMALLKPPGEWGQQGADIACGEGQPLGVPLASGGPYFGFLTCKQEWIRQMPGRLVGATVDTKGRRGFCLTLQAREQHIRRSKATSNICTNQGLLVVAATIYMSLIGFAGLQKIARQCHANAIALKEKLITIPGVRLLNTSSFFHEFAVHLPKPVSVVLQAMADQGIEAGFDLSPHFPTLGNALLICSTDIHSADDLDQYYRTLKSILS